MTATDSLAINGFSQYDPYLMQALSSPNYYQMLQAQQKDAHVAVADNTRVAKTPAISNPSFQGVPRATETESSGGSGKALLLTAGAIAIGATAWIASRGKAAGAKGFWNKLQAGFKSFGKTAKTKSNPIQIRNVNGQNIISLSNSRGMNIRTGSYTNATQLANDARNLGLQFNPTLNLKDHAARLNSTKFDFTTTVKGKKGKATTTKYEGIYRKGELVGLKDVTNNKTIDLNNIPQDAEATVKSIIEGFPTKKVPSGVTLKDTTYIQTFEGGQAMFLANNPAGKNGLRVVKTNRYKMNDDAVTIACGKDTKLKEGIKAFNAGKLDSWEITDGIWKPAKSKTFWEKHGLKKSSEYKGAITGKKWDDSVELVVKNGEVVGLTKDGGKTIFAKSSTDTFKALEADFPEIFNNISTHNKDFTGNIVRTLA